MSFSRSRWNLAALVALACISALAWVGSARAAATISVTTQSDGMAVDNHCSLREAIANANAGSQFSSATGECAAGGGASGTTISIPDGTYVLSGGQLLIGEPVTITGTANHPTVFANTASRVFAIAGGAHATISGLEIAGGLASNGGGILNNGTLTLTDDAIDNNATIAGTSFGAGASNGGSGAGLDNEGTASLTRVTFDFNHTGAGGSGSTSGGFGGDGGGIYNAGTLTLTDSHITQNSTGNGGDGGNAGVEGGAGAGIFNAATGTLTVTGGEISSNSTGAGGAGGVGGGSGGAGAGVEAHGTVTISGTSISSNRTGDGGTGGVAGGFGGPGAGIDAGMVAAGAGSSSLSSLALTNNALANNARGADRFTASPGVEGGAVNVDAMSSASVTIADSAITGTGGVGVSVVSERRITGGTGAIQFTIANTTITGGSAAGVFAQTISDDTNHPASLTGQLAYATIARNTGAGIANAGGLGQATGPALTAQNSLIAANGACTGTITDGGHNLSFANAGCPGVNADPKLGTLGNHGGPTPTIPLLAGSAAIDAIPAADASCTGTDQRGIARPAGSGCDIGAYEAVPPKLAATTATATGISTATVAASVTPGDADTTVTVHYGPTTSYGSQVTGPTLPAATTASPVSVSLTGLTPGTTYHARLVATSAAGTTTSSDLTFTTSRLPAPPPGGGSTAAPRLSALTITPASFIAAKRGPSIARTAAGARIAYRDTLAATTTFTVTRLLAGHRSKSGTCSTAPVRKGQRHGKACTKTVPVGQFRHIDRAGANGFRFTGRLNGRTLVAGRYALTAIARLAGKSSAPLRRTFTIRS